MNQSITDNNPSIIYNGPWLLNQFTDPQNFPETFHSTGQNGSTIFMQFNGTRILAIGMFPPGNDSLTANYSIDGGQPTLSSVPFISQSTSLLYQQFFASQNLSSGLHNITITILETGPSRNYSFQSFTVFQDIAEGGSNTNSPHELDGASDTNIAAIVGGVLGAVIVLLFCLLGWSHFKRRRMSLLRRSTGTDESVNSASGINPFMLPPVGVVEPTVECTNLPQSTTTIGETLLPPYVESRV